MTRRWWRPAGGLTLAACATVATVWLLPRVARSSWSSIADTLSAPAWWQVAGLVLLWATSLAVHAVMLRGAMPGLSLSRALTLNLTGSAVANVLPLGGGVGIGLNYLMARRWGFSRTEFTQYTLLTNLLHLLCKGLLPVIGLGLLLGHGHPLGHRLLVTATTASAVLVAIVTTSVLVLANDRISARVDALGLVVAGSRRRAKSPLAAGDLGTARVGGPVTDLARTVRRTVREQRRPLALGLLGTYSLGAPLMWACLQVPTGHPVVGLSTAVGLFALERALTALPVTPGGAGVVEVVTTAAAAALVGPGHAAALAAGVLLYRALVFALEIPVGGAWLAGWLVLRRRIYAVAPSPALPVPRPGSVVAAEAA